MQNSDSRVRGVADLVFVVDISPSMDDIIDSLKTYISSFVDSLLNDPQSTVRDVRLGLVLHNLYNEQVFDTPMLGEHSFTTSAEEFSGWLERTHEGNDEFGLPAVDRALDFPWRPHCRRYIVFFSDEPVSTGHDPGLQNSKLNDLAEKLASLHVHFIGFNQESCPSYELLGKTPGSTYSVVARSELVGPNMAKLLVGLAKTVSAGIDSELNVQVQRNLYDL